ncbi:MAG: LysR family transcriptional regulator [Paracoccaceae bacterium]
MLHQTDLSRVDLNLLVLFEAVLAEQNVARAAARLNLSPSAVSHGLSRLRRLFNDPLFLRTPKGVVPTDRGLALAVPVAQILRDARKLMASADPFDPATSDRRFVIGAPDGGDSRIVLTVLEEVTRTGPNIDLAFVNIMPGNTDWTNAFASLDAREADVMILPLGGVDGFSQAPARFASKPLYDDGFVVAMRQGHPLAQGMTTDEYCAQRHVLVSASGSRDGFVDVFLAQLNLSRRVVVTVPNFLLALDVIAHSDLITAAPKVFLAEHASRFGLTSVDMPISLPQAKVQAILPKAGLSDAGLVWLLNAIEQAVSVELIP